MTSVVDTSVKHFHSAMVGAPILNGVAGSMISLLDACLKDGFDTKVASSLVVSGGIATLSFTGTHSASVDSVVLVTGSSIAALNGEQKVTAIGAGLVRFATAAADGAAGTPSFKMAPAGWLKPFAGTNLAVYKSTDVAGTGMHLRMDDTDSTVTRVRGYETMSDVNTGAGPFPRDADIAGGGYWPKSSIAGTTPIGWTLIADGRKFIFSWAAYGANSPSYIGAATRGFGDDLATRPGGDPYACTLSYADSGSPNDTSGLLDYNAALNHASPRGYTGLGSCVRLACSPYTGLSSLSGQDSFFGAFPSAVDGGLRLSKKFFAAGANQPPRSDLPGLYHVPMSNLHLAFGLRDVISGTGALAGRKLLALLPTVSPTSNGASNGISFVDITGPWR
ncbi:hypothetical protein [Polaromonas glacialis]|uniref:hypothetical protein n=1 Tax=Polaromonas glacialis TaxID=866564 RepID=UPI000496C9C9|nr:hypothetical protein [Polaromonas glacialis]